MPILCHLYSDFSRKTWIYFLKKKNEVFKWFRDFKALVENQIGNKIKILRTDNGTKYESNEFNDYCREIGIKRETTTGYTPEQNGVAKRKNRTILEVARAMLYDQGLPKFLRGEVANTAVYVQYRCPHSALDSKTSEEVFSGMKPNVCHFRVFGSPVYFHVPKEKRSKLDASGKKGTFLGYSETSKAYRIMCLVKEKWRYVMMSPSMKMLPSGRLEILLSLRKTKKKKQESKNNERMNRCLMLKV